MRHFLWFLVCWLAAVNGFTSSQAQAALNLALNRPVSGTGPTWPGYPASNLTDGNASSFTHPQASTAVKDYYFQVDLGRSFQLDQILLRSRNDGCCPERLTQYRIEIYADRGGDTGALNWSATFRMDGSYPPSGGSDTITAASNPAGAFVGRFVRVVNAGGAAYSPQLAEIEVYGSPGPRIELFAAEDDALTAAGPTTLRWSVQNAAQVRIDPEVGQVPATGFAVVQPRSTTTYTLTATGPVGDTVASVTVGVGLKLGPPLIMEFAADNTGGLTDETGHTPDWIELHNTNQFGLNLEGFHLTDDPAALSKWRFPTVRLPAGGRLVVFASGEDRRDPRTPLHTNFKLEAKGDYLALVAQDGRTVVQQFPADYPVTKTFPPQHAKLSYGWGSNGVMGYLKTPTPGAPNGAAFAGVVGDTHFTTDRGFYETNQVLEIRCDTPGAVIRYTLDRSEPTATQGLIYTTPLVLSNTVIVRAAAFVPGWAPSDVDTQTYLFPSNILASSVLRTSITRNAAYAPQLRAALTDVPSISLTTRETINGTTEVKTSFEWIEPDGSGGTQVDCGIQQFGGAFTDFAKKSFRLYFRGVHGASKLKYPLFAGHEHGLAPVEEFDQLELRNGSHDMEMRGFYMANLFTDDTLREMGHLSPHGRFVHLYLNGVYWGLYHLRERWGAAMHASYLGGGSDAYESINGNWNVGGWADPGTPYDGDGSVWTRIKGLRTSYRSVKPWLDVPDYIDYMLLWMFGGSEDEYRAVGPITPGTGMKFMLNDADGWFCGPWYCAADNRTSRGAPGRQAGDGPGSLFSTLFAEGDPEYRILLADHIHQALTGNGTLTPARLAQRLSERCDQIGRAFLLESARWNYLTPATWISRRDTVLNGWLKSRTAEVLTQWRNAGFLGSAEAPVLNPDGGVVAAGAQPRFVGPTTGAIYYTLDGTDPRLPGGAPSASARIFSTGGRSETWIPTGSTWRWYTDATGLGSSALTAGRAGWSTANWKHPDFDDTAWKAGPAQLGYGEGDEATQIPFGPDASKKWNTIYFRHSFKVAEIQGLLGMSLRLKRDDGAIVYLNGVEVGRDSMPAGEALATTLASNASDDGQGFTTLTVPVGLLHAGINCIAVELHQSGPTTSDASFDLELIAQLSGNSVGEAMPTLDRNTLVLARTRNGNAWSALHRAFFQISPRALDVGEVRISELGIRSGLTNSAEFIELLNVSRQAVNLRGAALTRGVRYPFSTLNDTWLAPGGRLVLVNDLFAFRNRYGLEIPVAGVYTGRLDEHGEELEITALDGTVITRFRYDDTAPWPMASADSARTLVLAHPDLDSSDPAAWRLSREPGGTPGTTEAVVFSGDPLADADHDGLTALMEYALGSSDQDGGASKLPRPRMDAAGRVTWTLPRNPLAEDVSSQVDFSLDLRTWTPAGRESGQIDPNGLAQDIWRTPAPVDQAVFLRFRVERRP